MRKSRWLVASGYKLQKRGNRFLVDLGSSRVELAARRVDLLVLYGRGLVSSDAALLAHREGVTLVFIDPDGGFSWIPPRPKRDVKYLVAQRGLVANRAVASAVVNSYILSALEVLRPLGYAPNPHIAEYVLSIRDPAARLGEAWERLEPLAAGAVDELLGLGYEWSKSAAQVLTRFLEAEALAAILSAGLTPHLGLGLKPRLYEELALEFRFPAVWAALASLRGSGLEGVDPGSVEGVKALAKALKARVEGMVTDGVGRLSLRSAMRRRARALAASAVGPVGYREVGWRPLEGSGRV